MSTHCEWEILKYMISIVWSQERFESGSDRMGRTEAEAAEAEMAADAGKEAA